MKKNYYYVLVFTITGPVYVTSFGPNRTCTWDRLEKPKAMAKAKAEEVACGLGLNFTSAVQVVMPYELDHQPYNYVYYEFGEIKQKEEENVNEK